jgi:hypothetical protein
MQKVHDDGTERDIYQIQARDIPPAHAHAAGAELTSRVRLGDLINYLLPSPS